MNHDNNNWTEALAAVKALNDTIRKVEAQLAGANPPMPDAFSDLFGQFFGKAKPH